MSDEQDEANLLRWLGRGGFTEGEPLATVRRIIAERDAAQDEVERLKPFEPRIIDMQAGIGKPLEVGIACADGFLRNLVKSFDAMVGDGNYAQTTATMEVSSGENKYDRRYVVTVRRYDKPTDHDLRKVAEAERDAAKRQLGEQHLELARAADTIAAMQGEAKRLRGAREAATNALQRIAEQHTTSEMDEDFIDDADFQCGYDTIIKQAREALKGTL